MTGKLDHGNQRHLDAAQGWLGLGDHLAANEELEQITPQLRDHPFVLEMSYKIYSKAGKWDMAVEVAKGLREILPDNQWGHFYTAYALHKLKLTQDTYDTLKAVIEKFSEHFLMRYNLACYSCQLGKLVESLAWLEKAIDLAGEQDIRSKALDDPDLEPLWSKIGEI